MVFNLVFCIEKVMSHSPIIKYTYSCVKKKIYIHIYKQIFTIGLTLERP